MQIPSVHDYRTDYGKTMDTTTDTLGFFDELKRLKLFSM